MKKRHKLKRLKIRRVAAVRRGANPDADIVLHKQDPVDYGLSPRERLHRDVVKRFTREMIAGGMDPDTAARVAEIQVKSMYGNDPIQKTTTITNEDTVTSVEAITRAMTAKTDNGKRLTQGDFHRAQETVAKQVMVRNPGITWDDAMKQALNVAKGSRLWPEEAALIQSFYAPGVELAKDEPPAPVAKTEPDTVANRAHKWMDKEARIRAAKSGDSFEQEYSDLAKDPDTLPVFVAALHGGEMTVNEYVKTLTVNHQYDTATIIRKTLA